MFASLTARLVGALVVIAAIFGLGFAAGKAFEHPRALEAGHTAGVNETTQFYAGKLEQQTIEAKADFDRAVARNDQLKADYASLKATWQVDHDAAVATQASLTRRLTAAGADTQRLRVLFANAAASAGGRCRDSAGPTGPTDPGVGAGVPTTAGGSLSEGVAGLSGQPGPFDRIADLLRRADDVVTVANECRAAIQVK